MNVEQLKYFRAVTKHNTFLEAAEEMNISQSSLSKHIRRLEAELGVTLFDRTKRKAELTEAGKIFAVDSEMLLNQYNLTLSHLQPFRKSNTIRIGSLAFLGQYGLNYRLAYFLEHHNEYSLLIEDVEEDLLLEGFRNGIYDMIIGRTLPSDIPADYAVKIAVDELVAVMRTSHPLASREFIELPEIISMPMFLTKSYTSIYKICMKLFSQYNLAPKKVFTSRSETIISMIFAQNAAGLLPLQGFNIFEHSGLSAVPLKPVVKIPVVIFVRNRHNSEFMKELIEALKNQNPES